MTYYVYTSNKLKLLLPIFFYPHQFSANFFPILPNIKRWVGLSYKSNSGLMYRWCLWIEVLRYQVPLVMFKNYIIVDRSSSLPEDNFPLTVLFSNGERSPRLAPMLAQVGGRRGQSISATNNPWVPPGMNLLHFFAGDSCWHVSLTITRSVLGDALPGGWRPSWCIRMPYARRMSTQAEFFTES